MTSKLPSDKPASAKPSRRWCACTFQQLPRAFLRDDDVRRDRVLRRRQMNLHRAELRRIETQMKIGLSFALDHLGLSDEGAVRLLGDRHDRRGGGRTGLTRGRGQSGPEELPLRTFREPGRGPSPFAAGSRRDAPARARQ